MPSPLEHPLCAGTCTEPTSIALVAHLVRIGSLKRLARVELTKLSRKQVVRIPTDDPVRRFEARMNRDMDWVWSKDVSTPAFHRFVSLHASSIVGGRSQSSTATFDSRKARRACECAHEPPRLATIPCDVKERAAAAAQCGSSSKARYS